ncbi:MAG: phospho-N-acetylmuramoyl-pentapeptide-transferase [Archangium gephyra]|uniref:Phospho-N-acetylmuramoyl-pentapeptide-transferase n=1 Tax=Archangium gephyra TaxID=48 RepID=A0A2W5TAZ1_9BACT|nr:MAG: phospho-N-acetylmuramoyl-pentapeptide-transferase [Archangium gephyra]
MLYLLYEWLKDGDAGKYFNFLRYPTFRIVAAATSSLVIGMLVGPGLINRLRIQQHGQSNVREDTPESHQKKKGTPTLGGTLILLSIFLGTILFADLQSRVVWVALLMTAGYGFTGFLDDYLKLSKRNSKGLAGRYKMVLQTAFFLISVFGIMTDWSAGTPRLLIETHIILPFVPTKYANPDLGWLYVFFAWIVVVGTSNAVNMTDGLDGLAIAPTMIASFVFVVLCYAAGSSVQIADYETVGGLRTLVGVPIHEYLGITRVDGGAELAVFCASIIGAGISFLWFNAYPASVFMGDVGSLALGGALGTVAMLSKNEVLSAIIHGVFLAEILSVMIQVTSFKLTGKRVFKMAPLHHHFEKGGMGETKIVIRFWIVSVLLGAIALASLKLR